MAKQERLRFSSLDDVVLLRQVLGVNPYENGWKEVQEAVVQATGKNFNVRCLREHVQHLMKLYTKEDVNNLRKSGTEEEYAEKEELLQQLKDLSRDMAPKLAKKKGEIDTRKKGLKAREEASLTITNEYAAASCEASVIVEEVENSIESSNGDSPLTFSEESTSGGSGVTLSTPGSSRLRQSRTPQACHPYLSFLKQKQERVAKHEIEVLSLKERKLQLEEEKLQFEREKFQLERKEREARLEIERVEQEHRIAREKKQLEVIDLLSKLINKN